MTGKNKIKAGIELGVGIDSMFNERRRRDFVADGYLQYIYTWYLYTGTMSQRYRQ